MKKSLELTNFSLEPLSSKDLKETDGGFLFLLVGLAGTALIVGAVAALGTAIYNSAERGYEQACGCQ